MGWSIGFDSTWNRDAARNRPIQKRPWKRHPEYERRLEIIALRRAEKVTWREIAQEIGVGVARAKALGQLIPPHDVRPL